METTTNKPSRVMCPRLEVGDLVRVTDGTHDPAMSEHRTGLIVEVITESVAGFPRSKGPLYMVRFGEATIKFHPMFLQKV
jgi:hypothetical protein